MSLCYFSIAFFSFFLLALRLRKYFVVALALFVNVVHLFAVVLALIRVCSCFNLCSCKFESLCVFVSWCCSCASFVFCIISYCCCFVSSQRTSTRLIIITAVGTGFLLRNKFLFPHPSCICWVLLQQCEGSGKQHCRQSYWDDQWGMWISQSTCHRGGPNFKASLHPLN